MRKIEIHANCMDCQRWKLCSRVVGVGWFCSECRRNVGVNRVG